MQKASQATLSERAHDVSEPVMEALAGRLSTLIARGGPTPPEYADLEAMVVRAWEFVGERPGALEHLTSLRGRFPVEFLRETVHGHGLEKPMGYAGDFLMIDKIYLSAVSPHEPYRRWDQYFHQHAAPRAVRGRKVYFQKLIESLEAPTGRPLEVLNLGTGPGRDLSEYLKAHPQADVRITSVDIDPRASAYARQVLGADEHRVRLVTENALRFTTDQKFDLVWSAGLFDYLTDRLFVGMIRRAQRMLRSGGQIVVGNFSPSNPSRPYMELLGDWHLRHRSVTDLQALAQRSGFAPEETHVGAESLGVNLFLHLTHVTDMEHAS